MTSSTGRQIIAIHTLPNIPRTESNQKMKFGELSEYNMKNTCAQKSCR